MEETIQDIDGVPRTVEVDTTITVLQLEKYHFALRTARVALNCAIQASPPQAHAEYEKHVIQPLAHATAYLEKLLIGISDQEKG